jgi:FtsK/SpoIIIE family
MRRRGLARLRQAVVEATADSPTKRGMLRARRWRLVHVPGLRLRRYRPTDVLVRYPHTFPDHDPNRQAELERRVASKMGGTWYAQWNTTADRVHLRSPDPLVGLGGVAWPNSGATHLSLWDPIPVGVGADGQPVTINLIGKNLLIGGEPESGKSVAQSLIVATAALDPDVVLYGIDGKRVELAPWAPAMERCVYERGDAIQLLEDLRAIVDCRYELLLGHGRNKVTRGDGNDLHVLIIDELALYTAAGSKAERDRFTEALRDVISRGRAAGVIVCVATQRPSATVVSTDVRDLIGYRWAMRISTPQASDMILGQGQASAGYSSARVAAEHRGIGYLLAEGANPVRLRSYRIDEPELAALAARAARLRRPGAAVPVGANGTGEQRL